MYKVCFKIGNDYAAVIGYCQSEMSAKEWIRDLESRFIVPNLTFYYHKQELKCPNLNQSMTQKIADTL